MALSPDSLRLFEAACLFAALLSINTGSAAPRKGPQWKGHGMPLCAACRQTGHEGRSGSCASIKTMRALHHRVVRSTVAAYIESSVRIFQKEHGICTAKTESR
jgi:hypothetical protein